jgi:hypothetical protein
MRIAAVLFLSLARSPLGHKPRGAIVTLAVIWFHRAQEMDTMNLEQCLGRLFLNTHFDRWVFGEKASEIPAARENSGLK